MFNRFISQLQLIEKNIYQAKESLEEFQPEVDISDAIMPIINLKFHDFYSKNQLDMEEVDNDYFNEDMNEFARRIVKKSKICGKLYESLEIDFDDKNDATLSCSIPGMLEYFLKKRENGETTNFFKERELLLKTSVMSLCTTFETFASSMMTEFFLDIDNSNYFDKKTLSFKDLKFIGSIEDARKYLIDEELDNIFRKGFNEWFDIIDNKFNITKEFTKERKIIEEINELYLRRNLFVHTDGVVGDIYLKKCDSQLVGDLQKGDNISASPDYILEKIKKLERIAWLMYYKYSQAKYHNKVDQLFTKLNGTIVSNLRRENDVIPELLQCMINNKKNDDEAIIVAKINYFLYYKINGRLDEVSEELAKFNTNHYSNRYVMAKQIILGENCVEEVQSFIDAIDDDEFFNSLEWPLFSIIKKEPEYKFIFMNRMEYIFEGNAELVESIENKEDFSYEK